VKHQVPGLHGATPFPEGFFLVRVTEAYYRTRTDKPFLAIDLVVTGPAALAGRRIPIRLYCTHKALWRLNWFLQDFGYDPELFGRDQIDAKAVVGLCGVIKISHSQVAGRSFVSLDGFAPAAHWDEFRLEKAG
jgi:hypothetical protein